MKLGLTLDEIEEVSGRQWVRPDQPGGPGAYAWIAGRSGELIYAGCAVDVPRRLRDQRRWAFGDLAKEIDRPGTPACMRLIVRFECTPFVALTDAHDQARDLEALLGAANVHTCGMPPLGWGLAWAPSSPRAVKAWEQALEWAGGGKA